MKNILLIFALSMLTLTACKTGGSKANSPEGVARKFLNHLAAMEFDEARKLGTENTRQMLDLLQSLVDIAKDKGADQIKAKDGSDIEIIKTAVDGNTAVVTYKDAEGKEQSLDLVREKGKWLVDMKKENGSTGG